MGKLQEIYEEVISENLMPSVISEFIRRKLAHHGVVLTDEQIEQIRKQVRESPDGSVRMELDEEQKKVFRAATGQDELVIELSEGIDEIKSIYSEQIEKLADPLNEFTEDYAKQVLDDYLGRLMELSDASWKEHEGFSARLLKTWERPLRLLRLHIDLALGVGSEFNHKVRPTAAADNDLIFEAMTRLHARACQVASEILVLLQAGFADGAHARWRSLHELNVAGQLLKMYNNDLANRYLLHDAIESYKAAKQHRRYSQRLNVKPVTDEEFAELKQTYDALVDKFGPSYKNNYGWAAEVIGNKNPNFVDLESKVGLAHWRPYYKLASHNVHAQPKGVYFRLGLYPGSENTTLLAGPSNAGLADPGHATALSLGQLTISLLMTRPNWDRIAWCKMLLDLADKVGESFLMVHNKLQDDSADEDNHTDG